MTVRAAYERVVSAMQPFVSAKSDSWNALDLLRDCAEAADAAAEALPWFDFIEEIEADGDADEPLTISITRTRGGWVQTRVFYNRATAALAAIDNEITPEPDGYRVGDGGTILPTSR